jgi:hypothetical protein
VSNKKPRLRAVEEGRIGLEEREWLGILESWTGMPISMNSILDGLREVRRHPVGNVREERTEIVGCRFEGIGRRRERYGKLSVISIEVVVVSARE